MEMWRAIPGFEGWYEASDLGRCRIIQRPIRGGRNRPYPMVLAPLWYRKGYFKIQLGTCNGTRRRRRLFLHRIVWEAFHGPIPAGLTVNHLDGNPANNAVANLELADFVRQSQHAISLGLARHRTKQGWRTASLTPDKIREMRRLRADGWTQYALASHYGVSRSNVRWILIRRTWSHVT